MAIKPAGDNDFATEMSDTEIEKEFGNGNFQEPLLDQTELESLN